MGEPEADFLDAIDREFKSQDSFVNYIHRSYLLDEISGEFNVIGSINNLDGGSSEFLNKVENEFRIVNSTGDLHLLHTTVENESVYSYVYADDDAPVFLTNANKTDQIPPTVWRFLQETYGIGRLMLSNRQVDQIRKRVVGEHENIVIPYFSARRKRDSSIDARRRPDEVRSVQYRADDGLDTYKEMRFNYGVLPQIMVFEQPNEFKFKVKADGTFVHQKGGIKALWSCLRKEIDRMTDMKKHANTAGYGPYESSFFEKDRFSVSSPWAVEIKDGIKREYLDSFQIHLDGDFWEFSVSEYRSNSENESFQAEVIDHSTNVRTTMKSRGKEVRIYPREETDIDQSNRLYNFLGDHFDSDCTPKRVA
jgi:hypothetical protein